ncbi:MAG: glycosyl transferase [Synergistaceae bacterium]|nr:glycosyl transferase [Synergistaceae bacterium]
MPKIIHYCWFGRASLPEQALKCIASWKKFCPDYQIIEWNEDNFDLDYCPYTREAYDSRKFAFVTDVVRLYAMITFGGIYMDTDVEVIKPLDDLLQFHAVSGFESVKYIPTGLMACEKNNPAFSEFLREYDGLHFISQDGTQDITTNCVRITNKCLEYGLRLDNTEQTLANGFHILPIDYLCPKDLQTGKINLTANTYTIHHFNGSWLPEETRYRTRLSQKMLSLHVPGRISGRLVNFMADKKFRGLSFAVKSLAKKFVNRITKEG